MSVLGLGHLRVVVRCLQLVLAAVLFALSASAQTYALNNVRNPRVADGGFVTDPEGLLGSARGVIDARLRALEQRSGAEIALVILPSIGDAVPKQFATALFEAWGIRRAAARAAAARAGAVPAAAPLVAADPVAAARAGAIDVAPALAPALCATRRLLRSRAPA